MDLKKFLRSFCALKEQKFVRSRRSESLCSLLPGLTWLLRCAEWRKDLSIILPLMTPDGPGSASLGPIRGRLPFVDVLAWCGVPGHPLQIYNRAGGVGAVRLLRSDAAARLPGKTWECKDIREKRKLRDVLPVLVRGRRWQQDCFQKY